MSSAYVADVHLEDINKLQQIHKCLSCLILSDATIQHIKSVFEDEMERGLNKQTSSLQMENTFVPQLPDGTESGIFLALDLGGTNFRIILLSLVNGCIEEEYVKFYKIPDELRVGCGESLFEFLAQCLDAFATESNLKDDTIYYLGFTFSFPMRQNALDCGILVTWTKSFNCPSVVGQDVVQILQRSLHKYKRTNIKVVAILNDTTGTLIHGAFMDKQTRIGVVLGTGSNGCYIESTGRLKNPKLHQKQDHLIDVEWGAFGDNGVLNFIKTEFDWTVDNESLLKNSFTFEKYIGGKYLGELCRVILYNLYIKGLFLGNTSSESFPKPWSFGSNIVSSVEHNTVGSGSGTLDQILQTNFHTTDCTPDDMEILRYVCGVITLRAAQLVAITISVLLNRMDDEKEITVAIDGSVYRHHPRLRQWIAHFTKLWAPTKNSKFMLTEDGSGKGAALVAAIAAKIKKNNHL